MPWENGNAPLKTEFILADVFRDQIKEDKKEQFKAENGENVKKSGQNKNRKRDREDKHIKQFSDKLCPSLHDEFSSYKKPCFSTLGTPEKPRTCKFQHDIDAYLSSKPPDITLVVSDRLCFLNFIARSIRAFSCHGACKKWVRLTNPTDYSTT